MKPCIIFFDRFNIRVVVWSFLQGLNNHFGTIKSQVTELHRDVTERRCFSGSGYQRVEDIVIECTQLTNELEKTDQLMKDRKDLFHKMWEEEQQRIMTEQQIFKEQVTTRYQVCVLCVCYG